VSPIASKNITIGYFNLLGKKFISRAVIDENFLRLLSGYVNVKIISLAKADEIIAKFNEIEKYKLDYLYIDSFGFLMESFLLREKSGINVPFICNVHTVVPWAFKYTCIIPLIQEYDIIFAPSQYARQSILRISDKLNVHVIPYVLDVRRIENIAEAARKKRSDKYKIISFLGRISKGKGIGSLISCMPDIAKRVKNARLHIMGPLNGHGIADTPKCSYVKYLERKIKRLNLEGKIRFLGVQLGDDKYRALASSDLFVNPTIAKEETFSAVNTEALACGLPIIVTDWAGNNELVKHGRNGYRIDVKEGRKRTVEMDKKKAVLFITKALNDGRLRARFKRGSIKSGRTYDYKKILPVFIKLLKKRKAGKKSSGWNIIKNKAPIDFKDMFTKGVAFFIHFDSELRMNTYGFLYKRMFEDSLSDCSSENISRDDAGEKRAPVLLVDSIRREYTRYLTLQSF
jgi:glycosyltransferase involved in cell wall biosynthesis